MRHGRAVVDATHQAEEINSAPVRQGVNFSVAEPEGWWKAISEGGPEVAVEFLRQAAVGKRNPAEHEQQQQQQQFGGADDGDKARAESLAEEIFSMLNPDMLKDIRQWNKSGAPAKSEKFVAARQARAKKTLTKTPLGTLYNMKRALIHHYKFCSEYEVPAYPTSEDVIIEALECYNDDALERGELKQRRQREAGEEVTGRGGETATKPVRLGYAALFRVLGLTHFEGATTEEAKQV